METPLNQMKPMPKTWLMESILTTLFCFLPFGIVSIIYATRVGLYHREGLYEKANAASKDAKKWAKWSLLVAITFWVIYIVFAFMYPVDQTLTNDVNVIDF